METDNNNSPEKGIPVFKILKQNILLIILIIVLCGLLGLGYSLLREKTEYTATRSVILRTSVSSTGGGNSASQDAQLGKLHISAIEKLVKSPLFIKEANDLYSNSFVVGKGDNITPKKIIIKYKEDSLIFKMSYKDYSKEKAENKLNSVYEYASAHLGEYLPSEEFRLISTDKNIDINEHNNFFKNIMLGVLVGAVVAVLVVFIKNAMDNTVKDKSEFEEMTGVNVVAYISSLPSKTETKKQLKKSDTSKK